ncbi:hypothetical protein [Pseudobacteriovorax antillogorgiicola]|uniref:Lipoprotein n=1 Tax=Pseudobacteriovorax antillogorgiicola TaxID=1513793 RepID=A0A1Y6BYJ2_9BACT|nr:hypothetical protein [Pseudobacteriovorax antillogorgiicola]TCS53025.1 hypothetical protein EDD56_10876 [Pseudobacteriovorax antillogorgiicola]SMF26833.1 hypothetical protein SAMN06296036_108171 [Pseudobacteriovorax antillogorgiicola]
MGMTRGVTHLIAGASLLSLTACTDPLPWPDSPLYQVPDNKPDWVKPADKEAAKQAIAGHYAHYDVVAYEDETDQGPMRSFIISYGFTDFYLNDDGDLVEYDRFCHAEHRINQKNVQSVFSDAATQAIKPRVQVVDVFEKDGAWQVYRKATPTLIGIDGDPSQPISFDPNDPLINDDDGDGKPGVTVKITIAGFIKADLYIARREIFNNHLTLYLDGSLWGYVEDYSEQMVIDATLDMLKRPSNPAQNPDYGLSPMALIPISEDLQGCDELMAMKDKLFPAEPGFY